MLKPTICCIIPTANRVELLKATLNDLLCQTFEDYVIVIVDDGEDNTVNFIKGLNNPKIHYIHTPTILSIGAKYNLGAKEFPADYYFSANDDDFYSCDRFEKQLSILGKKRATCLKNIPYLNSNGKVYVYETKGGRMASGSTFACDYDFLMDIGGWGEKTYKRLDAELGWLIESKDGSFEYTEDALSDMNYWKNFLFLQHNDLDIKRGQKNVWKRTFGTGIWGQYYCDLGEYITMGSKDWLSIDYFKNRLDR